MSIINGSVSQSQSFIYYAQAKSEGTFKIGSAAIICNGKKLESPPKKEGVFLKNENESIEITDKIPKGVNAKAL